MACYRWVNSYIPEARLLANRSKHPSAQKDRKKICVYIYIIIDIFTHSSQVQKKELLAPERLLCAIYIVIKNVVHPGCWSKWWEQYTFRMPPSFLAVVACSARTRPCWFGHLRCRYIYISEQPLPFTRNVPCSRRSCSSGRSSLLN
jgi:hypothetical protein